MFSASASPRFLWVFGLSLAVGAFGVALFTELGQLLNLPSNWLYAVHPNLGWISALLVVFLFILYHHFRNRLLSRRLVVAYAVVALGMVFVTNYFVPCIWLRGHQHTAEFIVVPEADALLEDDAGVFVLEIGVHGNASEGRLERLPQYPHVPWMIWSHWFPSTKVMVHSAGSAS